MTLPPDEVIPVSSKVVYVPHYPVDRDGRIHGNGHPVRDTVEWMIPVLWPIDLINLPRRGPRPTLKAETRLTLKIMDDLVVPNTTPTQRDQYGFSQRAPVSYSAPPPQLAPVEPRPSRLLTLLLPRLRCSSPSQRYHRRSFLSCAAAIAYTQPDIGSMRLAGSSTLLPTGRATT